MRLDSQAIRQRRAGRETRFLVTGGTGFIGSHLAAALLQKGYRVFLLCRPEGEVSARERVARLMRWLEVGEDGLASLSVFEGFVDRPGLGLSEPDRAFLEERVDEIFHCAGGTSFAERERAELERVNVQGLRNVLDFAARGRCGFFHHMSTAYISGASGSCPEDLYEARSFNNAYEETKYRAERLAREACGRAGIACHIYRPSIVYGDSNSGKTIRFNALYYPIKTILFLKRILLRDILERGGDKAREMGVALDQGTLSLNLRVERTNGGRINLIPVDFLVAAVLAIMEEDLQGGVYHIVSRRPLRLEDLIGYTQALFRLKGIRAVPREDFEKRPRNALERLFEGYLDTYRPYLLDRRRFDSRKADAILRRRHIACPDLDFRVFSRIMNYALEAGWGKRLFEGGR